MWLKLIGSILPTAFSVIDKAVPDKDKALELKNSLEMQLMKMDQATVNGAISIITAEANGDSWLQRNWRPITMLTFTGLVVAHWLGFTPENLSEAQAIQLMGIIKVGIGGYVLGRSAEKTAKAWKGVDK